MELGLDFLSFFALLSDFIVLLFNLTVFPLFAGYPEDGQGVWEGLSRGRRGDQADSLECQVTG